MKNSFNKSIRFNIILALCLIIIGLLINHWFLGWLIFSEDGEVPLKSKILIWTFQILFIVTGLLVYFKGNTPKERKQLIFGFFTAAIVVIAIEAGLHIIVHLGHQEISVTDKRYLLSPYEDKEWAAALFKEYAEIPMNYNEFLWWRRGEYHGEYINVNSQGVRKTWNPEHYDEKMVDKVYVFGGSTLWGTGARDDYTIPSQLSKLFNNQGYNVLVYNYGETAYTFTQEVISLALLLREGHRPDYVIFYDGVNDVYAAYQSGIPGAKQNFSIIKEKLEMTNLEHIWSGVIGVFEEHCMVCRAIWKIMNFFSVQQKFLEVAATYDDKELQLLADETIKYYLKSIDFLNYIAQAYDLKYICFWQPVIFTEKELKSEELEVDPRIHDESLDYLYRTINDSLLEKSTPYFYVLSDTLYDRENSCYIDFAHLSEEGNELVATKIFNIFQKEFLIDE